MQDYTPIKRYKLSVVVNVGEQLYWCNSSC